MTIIMKTEGSTKKRKGGEMKKIGFGFFVSVLLGLFVSTTVQASEVDVLLGKLVDKGILTSSEAQQVRSETNEEVAKQDKEKQEAYKEEVKKSVLPDWVKNRKLTGDFRLRYEYKEDKGSEVATNRPRLRLRVGLEDQVNDKVKVGFMLATGISDTSAGSTRSNNQTLTGVFNKKPVILDKAFVEYTPKKWITLIGGKMANPIWEPMSFVWDPDISPEGGVVKLNGKLNSSIDWFANVGALVINDTSSGGPYLGFVQPGAEWHATNDTSVKAAVALYGYTNVKGMSFLNGSALTNTGTTGVGSGKYLYNYDAVNPTLEFDFDRLLEKLESLGINVPSFLDVPYISLFGSVLHNVNVSKNANAAIAGLKIGDKKIAKFGDWQFNYAYKVIERDAMLDVLPDDDFYSGKTNTRGNEYFFEFGLSKNTSLKLNYYHTWKIGADKASQVPENHFMMDFNFKF